MSTDQLEPSRQTRVPLLDEPDSDDSSVTVVQRRRLRPWIVFVQSCREKEKELEKQKQKKESLQEVVGR